MICAVQRKKRISGVIESNCSANRYACSPAMKMNILGSSFTSYE